VWRARRPFLPARSAVLEGEFGDAGFVEFAEAELDHAAELFVGRGGQREIEFGVFGESEGDPAVLGGVRGAEEAGVFAVLHILTVGL